MVVWTSATAVSHCWIYYFLLKEVGLAVNASKTKILTKQTQPGKTVTTQHGLEMESLDAAKARKWLGCVLSILNACNGKTDLDFRWEATSKALYVHKRILCDKNVSRNLRMIFISFCGDFGGPF